MLCVYKDILCVCVYVYYAFIHPMNTLSTNPFNAYSQYTLFSHFLPNLIKYFLPNLTTHLINTPHHTLDQHILSHTPSTQEAVEKAAPQEVLSRGIPKLTVETSEATGRRNIRAGNNTPLSPTHYSTLSCSLLS